jgi:hypothetical protein
MNHLGCASCFGLTLRHTACQSRSCQIFLKKIRDKKTRVAGRHYHFLRGRKKLQVGATAYLSYSFSFFPSVFSANLIKRAAGILAREVAVNTEYPLVGSVKGGWQAKTADATVLTTRFGAGRLSYVPEKSRFYRQLSGDGQRSRWIGNKEVGKQDVVRLVAFAIVQGDGQTGSNPLGRLTRYRKSEVLGLDLSGYPTSMISLCQEGKSSPGALRRSAGTNSF